MKFVEAEKVLELFFGHACAGVADEYGVVRGSKRNRGIRGNGGIRGDGQGYCAALCGYIHNFQHLRMEGSGIDYVVNTSASLSREVESIDGIQFSSSETGFSVVSVTPDSLKLHMLDKNGALLHTVRRGKNH